MLKWDDVSESSVEVKRRVYEGVIDSPKSERGFRKATISPDVEAELTAWRGTSGDGFIFPSEHGTPLSKSNVWRRKIQPILRTKGLEWCTFQVMRRTFVTLSKLAGGDPAVIAAQAGHDIGVSIREYTQSPVESKLKVVRAIEKMIFG